MTGSATSPTALRPAAAAARRAQLHAAARAVQHAPRRSQLSWPDLKAWPQWAAWEREALDALAWHAGVQWHATHWQRCIDGARLKALRERLGAAAFDALMQHTPPPQGKPPAPSEAPPTLPSDADLTAHGREVMLAALPATALRVVLRDALWPHTLPPVPQPPQALAQAALDRALKTPRSVA